VVMDLFSRRIVGWSMAATLHADIVLAVDGGRMRRRGAVFFGGAGLVKVS
jgi:transposase InsO family protein